MDVDQTALQREPQAKVSPACTATDLTVIVLLWGLAVMIANPVGEFPLNDDWSYSLAAKRLAEGGGYNPTSWTEMNLFTHAVWGAMFCLPAGFSFLALRISTLVLSLAGALALYGLIRQLQKPRGLALVGALALAFNPIYFALSHTFMADVPFTTLAIFSAWFFVRYLQKELVRDLVFATLFALIATLARQIGLFLPAAFGLTLLLKYGLGPQRWLRMGLPFLICVLGHMALRYWLQAAEKATPDTNMSGRLWAALAHPLKLPVNVTYFGWNMLMYLGWFLLPALLPGIGNRVGLSRFTPRLTWSRVAVGIFLAVTVVQFLLAPGLMPVHNNILTPQGIGPATLRDVFDLKLAHQPALPAWFWWAITLVSGAGAILLIVNIIASSREKFSQLRLAGAPPERAIAFFLLASIAAYLAPFLLCGFFDRYLLPVTAFLLAFLAMGRNNRWTRGHAWAAGAVIALTASFGVAATRDYLEWNRTRWEVVHLWLNDKGLQPEELDGGFEVNSWYAFLETNQPTRWARHPEFRQWVETVPYVMTFGEIDGFEVVGSYPYQNWLPPHEARILMLKRKRAN